MGWITHLLSFGAGMYFGTQVTSSSDSSQNNGDPWVKVNTSGIKVAEYDVVKVTAENVDVFNGFMHFERGGGN